MQHILRMDGYRDVIAARYGRAEEATTVHHIYPSAQYPEYAWADWNLISVSQGTHNKLENRVTGELTEEGKRLMRKTKPGVNWRKRPMKFTEINGVFYDGEQWYRPILKDGLIILEPIPEEEQDKLGYTE